MTYRLIFDIDDADKAHDLIFNAMAFDARLVADMRLGFGEQNVGDEIDDDEVQAEDVMKLLTTQLADAETPQAAIDLMLKAQGQLTSSNPYMRVIDQMLALAHESDAVEVPDTAPPHGIPRPEILRKPGWPEHYWINTLLHATQGSGKHWPGLEKVACVSCHAPGGEVCITGAHGRYRRGYGHTARVRDFPAGVMFAYTTATAIFWLVLGLIVLPIWRYIAWRRNNPGRRYRDRGWDE